MAADGGRCVSDLAVLAGQPALFGEVASVSTARRVLLSIGEAELGRVRRARAVARERAWRHGTTPGRVILDFDATPITMTPRRNRPPGITRVLLGSTRCSLPVGGRCSQGSCGPGNAGANNARDHLSVLDLALEQLPESALEGEILARSDSAGASHDLALACRECSIRFSFGYAIDERVRKAILALTETAWAPAAGQDGEPREGAWVAELTGDVSLASWPAGTRLVCRRERPHPGAQLSFTDDDGHCFQCFITDQPDPDIAALEVLHRQHAEVEDRVKTLKATGACRLP
jgi:DDE family transposase